MTDLSGSEPIDRWARSAHPERQLNKVIQLRVWIFGKCSPKAVNVTYR